MRSPGFLSKIGRLAGLNTLDGQYIDAATIPQSKLDAATSALIDGAANRNALDNGDFQIWQRGTAIISTGPFNNDDTDVTADRWILLSNGNDIFDVSRQGPGPAGQYYLQLDQETANKQGGIFQVVDGALSSALVIAGTVTLSFYAKVSSASEMESLRYGVLEWDGTVDTFNATPISAWNTGADPSVTGSWKKDTALSSDTPTTGWVLYSKTVTLQSDTTNLGVLIMSGSETVIAGTTMGIADVQLEAGSTATAFERRAFHTEWSACRRHMAKTFEYGTAPAQSAGSLGVLRHERASTNNFALTSLTVNWRFYPEMFKIPTCVSYNPGAADAKWRSSSGANDEDATIQDIGTSGVTVVNTDTSVTGAHSYFIHLTAETGF